MAQANGEVFLFTDDDVRVPTNWIERMSRPILADQADGVQGGVRPAPHLEREWMAGIYRSMLAIVEPRMASTPESLVGANMAFPRRVVQRVQGFQVELGGGAAGFGEDTLWGMQMLRAGYRLVYAHGADVEHHFDASRLCTEYFCNWVQGVGECNAMMSVRWLDDAPRHPRLLWFWTMAKYTIRRMIDWRRRPVPPQWYMSYRHRLAYTKKCMELLQS